MADDIIFDSLVSLAARIRRRDVSAVEVVEAHIRRIEAVNGKLNAFVALNFERAMSEARAADERLSRGETGGALHGVPVSVKDAINCAGLPTVAGSKLFTGTVAHTDATAVARLRAAGAIVLGKTNVPECAMDWRTVNPVFGRTSNPWNVEYSPGGSSGGEAAAIASGCSAGGLGTDLGGSIRVPAHFCGICGLRPTPGRVPASGYALPAPGTLTMGNTIGPLGRSVDDVQLLLEVIAGFDPCDPVSVVLPSPARVDLDARGLRLAVCTDGGIPVSGETRAAVDRAASLLSERGADVRSWSLPAIAEVPQVFSDWFLQPSLPSLLALYHGREDAMGPLARGLAAMAKPQSLERFLDAWAARNALRRSILERLEQRPVVILPVCSTAAFRHDTRGVLDVDGQRVEYTTSFGYAELASIAALPAATVPVARTADGLPVGVQLVGRPFEESLLLAVARLVEDCVGGFTPPPIT